MAGAEGRGPAAAPGPVCRHGEEQQGGAAGREAQGRGEQGAGAPAGGGPPARGAGGGAGGRGRQARRRPAALPRVPRAHRAALLRRPGRQCGRLQGHQRHRRQFARSLGVRAASGAAGTGTASAAGAGGHPSAARAAGGAACRSGAAAAAGAGCATCRRLRARRAGRGRRCRGVGRGSRRRWGLCWEPHRPASSRRPSAIIGWPGRHYRRRAHREVRVQRPRSQGGGRGPPVGGRWLGLVAGEPLSWRWMAKARGLAGHFVGC